MLKRLWILFRTELVAWSQDPISVLGGLLPPMIMLLAFGVLLTGRLTMPMAVLNRDDGEQGARLSETFQEVISPFGTPYFDVVDFRDEAAAWRAFEAEEIGAVWVIPRDFSHRVAAHQSPTIDIYFPNWSDDLAKNHRLYSNEVLWRFYEKSGYPAPPIALAETYPRDAYVGWFPLIGVGLVLLSMVLGAMFNIMLLTYREHRSRVTLEFGLAPRTLLWVFAPKVILAVLMGAIVGTVVMAALGLWQGVWPGELIGAVWLFGGLTALFWIAFALFMGLSVRQYTAGGIITILIGIVVFFVCGGMTPIRDALGQSTWFMWLFPNAWAVDPMRDLVLFNEWPKNFWPAFKAVSTLGLGALAIGLWWASRKLRRLD